MRCLDIVEKEAYAVIYNVKHFRHYLIGKQFTIRVDNRIISYFVETRHVKSEPLFNKVDKVDQPTTIDRHCDENKQIDLIEILLDTMDEADHIRTLNGRHYWSKLGRTRYPPFCKWAVQGPLFVLFYNILVEGRRVLLSSTFLSNNIC